jgi:hypothetical protein
MKIVSLFFTLLLILPIGYTLFSAYESYVFESKFESAGSIRFIEWHTLSYIIIDVVFLIIAIVLNAKEKYLVNSTMCGTLLLSFFLSLAVNFGTNILLSHVK